VKLSQFVRAQDATKQVNEIMQWQIRTLVSRDKPDWKLAGKLAVFLQRRGYDNAAKRVQLAATDEDEATLGAALRDLLKDQGIFPKSP
jgi:SOS response regulatory protein OraA/RecX